MAKSSSLSADLALLEPFWRETIERVVLPNGVTLLLKADPASAIASASPPSSPRAKLSASASPSTHPAAST